MKYKIRLHVTLRRCIITWVGLYPTLVLISILFGDFLSSFNIYLRLLITTMIAVPLMVCCIIPWLTKLSGKLKAVLNNH